MTLGNLLGIELDSSQWATCLMSGSAFWISLISSIDHVGSKELSVLAMVVVAVLLSATVSTLVNIPHCGHGFLESESALVCCAPGR